MPAATVLGNTSATFASVVNNLMSLVYTLEWLLSGIAFALFVFGMVEYVRHDNVLAKGHAREFMVWGVIALFVIFSVQGILYGMCSIFFSTTAQCSFFYWTGGSPT
ncbi:MAG: hypothetical protein QG621_237 [Patescibacteria group bacterium]|jgi:hypothetical protein|nr:hypothetical protein [Patescibacteria group bacterium]